MTSENAPMDAQADHDAPEPIDGFQALFEDAPCGFLCVSPDWRIERANTTFSEWTGFNSASLRGRAFVDLLDIAGKIYVGTHFAPLLRLQGKFDEVALNILRADGTKLSVLVNARERRDPDGALRMVLVSVFNATDRRRYEGELLDARNQLREANETLESRVEEAVVERLQAEEALAHAQRMEAIGNLSAGIAHDFNNLLQVIGGNLQLLRKHVPGEAGRARIERAIGGVERGARLAGQLLAFGRRQTLDAHVHDLGAAVRALADNLVGTLGGEVELRIDAPGSVSPAGKLHARIDPVLFENAVINLAVNARDAMRGSDGLASGTITLGVARARVEDTRRGTAAGSVLAGDYVVVTVADTGAGMPTEVAAKVFEPFFTTKGPGEGTGLGLSMVYGFVTQSSGHVTIDSALGKGTTIQLWLPHAEEEANTRTRTRRSAPMRGHETVLLVEDDEGVLEVARDLLTDLGYEVLTARDGTSALAVLDAHKPIHLVLTDMVMPGPIRGMALATLVRERASDTALLFTTGYAEMAAQAELREEGYAILRKPFTREALADAVRSALDAATGGRDASSRKHGKHAGFADGGGEPARSPREDADPRDDHDLPSGTGQDRETSGTPDRPPASAPSTNGKLRVLLVEDEFLIRMDAVEMLRDLGCRVEEAAGVAQARALLAADRFDVLITDIELEDALGTDLAGEARAIDPTLRIVFATGRIDVEDAERVGARVLNKPYDMRSLRSAIEAPDAS